MKFRMGFVSNSSTTSFCIYGVYVDDAEPLMAAFAKRVGLTEPMDEDDFYRQDMQRVVEKQGLKLEVPDVHSDPWDGGHWVGVEWKTVGDNETGADFKARVEAVIKGCFPGVDFEFDTHDEAWHGG